MLRDLSERRKGLFSFLDCFPQTEQPLRPCHSISFLPSSTLTPKETMELSLQCSDSAVLDGRGYGAGPLNSV